MMIVKLIFMVSAQASFLGADLLFMRSLFCQFHPLIANWVLHLPLHHLNSFFLFKLYHGHEVQAYQFGLHLKSLFQVSTSFCLLLLIGVFKEPLSDNIPDGLDVYLLASIALLIVYTLIVSSYLPDFGLGVNLTASLTGLYVIMLYNMSGIGFQLKGVALVALLSLIVIKICIVYAIESDKPVQEHQD